MVQEKAGIERYVARVKRYYIRQFWRFVRQNHAATEIDNGRLWLIIENEEQFNEFCETFLEDDLIDDTINAQIKGHKLYIAARELVPYSTDPEILAGKEKHND